jgi:hypothetical protein
MADETLLGFSPLEINIGKGVAYNLRETIIKVMKPSSHSQFVSLKALPSIFAIVWCSIAVIGFTLDYLTGAL